MKTLIASDKETVNRLAGWLRQASTFAQYQRIQCVLIRATLGSSAAQIARLLGWSTGSVHVLHSRWAKEGETVFEVRARGGRHRQNLSEADERALLAPFVVRAEAGNTLKVAEIRHAYEQRIGRPVAASTIYRLLDRHGWSKLMPRPRHIKADITAQAAFNKTASTPARRDHPTS
ncbi:MAG: winged helix-turn-helix domain-containing protein [Proteobacteria bacterium]|nr:winged helix-turn-helix domain-containing protein [Pseudomonadota bacterium]